MKRLDVFWEPVSEKSPELIYRCYQTSFSLKTKPHFVKTSWIKKLKEWVLPSNQAYHLPSYPISPEKYHLS